MATYRYLVGDEVRSYEVSDAAWHFFDACDRDPALGVASSRLDSMTELAALARTNGFATTAADLAQFLTAVNAAHVAMEEPSELTDEELDLVSGGGGVTATKPTCSGGMCKSCCSKGTSICAACKCPLSRCI
jgi:hypothetical protein